MTEFSTTAPIRSAPASDASHLRVPRLRASQTCIDPNSRACGPMCDHAPEEAKNLMLLSVTVLTRAPGTSGRLSESTSFTGARSRTAMFKCFVSLFVPAASLKTSQLWTRINVSLRYTMQRSGRSGRITRCRTQCCREAHPNHATTDDNDIICIHCCAC